MRKNDYNCALLCRMQGKLFMNYADYEQCSPTIFIRRFMNSNVAKRFDSLEILLERSSNASIVREIDDQYGITRFGRPNTVGQEVLYWAGYVYRYWSFTREIPSKLLIQKVRPEELFKRYDIYHSFGLDYLIDRLSEELKVTFEECQKKDIMQIIEEFVNTYKDK